MGDTVRVAVPTTKAAIIWKHVNYNGLGVAVTVCS